MGSSYALERPGVSGIAEYVCWPSQAAFEAFYF
jgi:hypothetical protein